MSLPMEQQSSNREQQMEARSYQLRLVDYVTKRNGIIYLPTGSGKTYVAILALKRFSQQMDKSIEDGGKRALFFCNTVELARQQAYAVKTYTNLKVGFYIGDRDVDDWKRDKWDEEISRNQVLVGTAQVILDLFTQKYMRLSSVSVVIFDECHHGTGQHPYHEFMRLFQCSNNLESLPRVIGLTGVLIKGNEIKHVAKKLKELETTYRGNIITVSDMKQMENVMLYSTKPHEFMLKYPTQSHEFEVITIIRTHINQFFKTLTVMNIGKQPVRMSKGLQSGREPNKKSYVKSLFNDFLHQLNDFGIYTASIAIMSLLVEFEIKKRQAETISLRNMYRAAITLSDNIRHLLIRKLYDMLDNENENNVSNTDEQTDTEEIIMNFSTPKVQTFLHYLRKTFGSKQPKDICCLVFVERRYSAKCIYGMLRNYIAATPELRQVLKPQFMVGGSGRNGLARDFENILERKWQKTAIQEFRDGECNLIVCSSVLEEGIDVQACNYVLILDPLKTFNMYVQTKGRARSKEAEFVIFSSELDKEKTVQQIKQYRDAHAEIATYLADRVLERAEPQMHEINEHFQDVITPYVNAHGAVLLASSALSLIHRYCIQLPMDAFGIVLPWFERLQENERVQRNKDWSNKEIVSITMPLTSTLKETIYSDPMSTAKWAKVSAAFKACIKLHLLGELNEHMLPTTVRERVAAIADVHFDHWKKYGDDVTAKHKDNEQNVRSYDCRCPTELYDAMPRVGEPCYAYEISIEPQFERNDYTAHMHDQLQTRGNYALLLRKRLPRLATMPLFSNQGMVHVNVAEQPQELRVESADQLHQLQRFHMMIFRDLLRIWQPFFVLDRRSKENSYLIVPMAMEGRGIDMQLVERFQRLPTPRSYSLAERRLQPLPRPEDFEGKIVTQWYANYEHKRMLVTKVHEQLTPLSMMEDKQKDNTYYGFTMAKYSSNIGDVVHKHQFLIEVRELTDRLNFYVNQRGKSSALSKARAKVLLIPELCYNFHFPGNLWLKLLFLPSILRRLTYMLHAEELRVRINKYLGLAELPVNGALYRPQPLTIDWSLRRNVDEVGNAIAEKYDEPKSLLEPLPSKVIEDSMEKLKISDMELPWQQYMEPTDLTRRIMSSYPVELNYYYKFTTGQLLQLDQMEDADKVLWTQTQFKMRAGDIYGHKSSECPKAQLPALMPASEQDATAAMPTCTLSVLERSVSNEHITAAEQCQFLAALTAASSVDVFDMERFELLGDCFLKLSATLYLANKYPNWNEGILTQVKSTLVSNRNLLYCLSETDIPERICSAIFTPKYTWLPPSISLPHNVHAMWRQDPQLAALIGPHNLRELSLSEQEVSETGECNAFAYHAFVDSCKANQHTHHAGQNFSCDINFLLHRAQLSNKLVADTLEALLGVVVKNYGLQHGFRMLEYFKICKPDIGKPLTQLLDLQLGGARMRANISARDVDAFLINHAHLEANLGYTFRDRAYLLQALTHPSFPTNRLTGCYQELEFIGDAILDFLISAYIFEHQTRMTPGELTDLRSALVNNTTLACICVRHRFHFFILAENSLLSESVKNFATFQESQGHRVTNHVRVLMEESDVHAAPLDSDDEEELDIKQAADASDTATATVSAGKFNLSHNVDVPKALGDVLEALIAAIYLDCRNLQTTWQVIYKLFEPELLEFSRNVPINPIRQLYEHKLAKPYFSSPAVDNGKVMISCQFTCIDKTIKVHGFGSNSKQAKLAAAKHALQKLAKCDT